MVDIKLVTNKFQIRDNQDDKNHEMVNTAGESLLVDEVRWVSVVEVEQRPVHTGGQNTIARQYEITMAYLPNTGGGEEVTAHVEKITTDSATTATLRNTFNNFHTTNVGLNAMPTNYINDNITYNLFFWSHGTDTGTSFNIYSMRVPINLDTAHEADITVLDGANTLQYSTTVNTQFAGQQQTHDVIFAST